MRIFKNLLRGISVTNITLMQDIKKDFYIKKTAKASYYNLKNGDLLNFIAMLQSDSLYSIVPMISINGKSSKPYIVLSSAILVSRYSNIRAITSFLDDKYDEATADFDIGNQENLELILKYRKIYLDFDQINQKFSKS